MTHSAICDNPPCQCEVTSGMEGGAYCSDYCNNPNEMEAEACACGHPPCDDV